MSEPTKEQEAERVRIDSMRKALVEVNAALAPLNREEQRRVLDSVRVLLGMARP